MPPYIVPQFIEKESKIAGPLTFKQLIFVVAAGILAVFFYFLLPLFLFVIVAAILALSALALAFFKVQGLALPGIIKNFFVFFAKPKVYLWKKKVITPVVIGVEKRREEKTREKIILGATEKGVLQKLSGLLETKTK